MLLNIITPEKILYSADARQVTIPGTEGDFGVLEGHAPFISTIRPGVITIESEGAGLRKISIMGGIAEVVPEHCTVLAEGAEDCTAMVLSEAQKKLDDAKAVFTQADTDAEKKDAGKKLMLAEALVYNAAA